MAQIRHLSSRDNPVLVRLRKLADDPTAYRKLGELWLEGEHLCEAYLQRIGTSARALISESGWASPSLQALASRAESVDIVADAAFASASGLESPDIAAVGPFELIVANILAGPLVGLVDSFAAAVRSGGRVLLSGLLVEQADEIVAAYGRRGFTLERHVDLETGGAWWRTLLLRRLPRHG